MGHVAFLWDPRSVLAKPVLAGAQGDDGGEVRHAETPELAQEALIDAVILIFKAQVGPHVAENSLGAVS
jgi:hypothetical protein